MLTVTFGTIATFLGLALIIGLAIGSARAARRTKEAHARIEAERMRLDAKAVRQARRREQVNRLLPWRRTPRQ